MNSLLNQMSQKAGQDPNLVASLFAAYCRRKGISRAQLAAELSLSAEQMAKLALCRRPAPADLEAQVQQISAYVNAPTHQLLHFFRSAAPDIYSRPRTLAFTPWLKEFLFMFSRRRVIASGLAALVILIVSAFAFAQPPAGSEATLVVSEGEATVVQAGRMLLVVPNRSETAVTAGSIIAVNTGDTIQIPAAAAAQLKLNDGSTVDLAAETTLQVAELVTTEDTYRVQLRLLAGRTVNRVVRLLGKGDTFDVQTPSSTASVRGTIFTVEVISASESYYTCDEGVVRVTMEGNFVDLHPGEEVTAVLGQPLTVRPQGARADEPTAPTAQPAVMPTETATPTATATPTDMPPTNTPTATATPTETNTPTPTSTITATATATMTATVTPTPPSGTPTQVPGNPPDDPPGQGDPPDGGGTPPGQGDKDTGPPGPVPGNPPDPPGQGDPPDGGGTPPGQGGTPPGQGDDDGGDDGNDPPGQGGSPPGQNKP